MNLRNNIDSTSRIIRAGHSCVGVATSAGLTLTASDSNYSLLWSRETGSTTGRHHTWTPWGNGKPTAALPGFNGERSDPVSGAYHLGNGYRAYNPVLRRFNCPDSMSPFGAGGMNPYAYCAGDPVNHTDPSGHLSWQGIVGIVAGVIGIAAAVCTAGASVAAAGGIMAALSSASAGTLISGSIGLASTATGIASVATEESSPKASSILGWVSFATGISSTEISIGAGIARKGRKLNSLMRNSNSFISLGGDVSDFSLPQTDIGIFTDSYKGKKRLNIYAHGQYVSTTRPGQKTPIGSYLINDSKLVSAENFVERSGVNFDLYDSIRVIACHSGDGDELSFGAKLHNLTGKQVKAYKGIVNTPPDFEPIGSFGMFRGKYAGDSELFLKQHFGKVRILKNRVNPGMNYRPVYFPAR